MIDFEIWLGICFSVKMASAISARAMLGNPLQLGRQLVYICPKQQLISQRICFSSRSRRGLNLHVHTNYKRDRHSQGNKRAFNLVFVLAMGLGVASAVIMANCEGNKVENAEQLPNKQNP